MNILITFFNASINTFGGMEKSIFTFIKGLEKKGCSCFVYTADNGEHNKNFYYSKYLKQIDTYSKDIDDVILNMYRENSISVSREIEDIVKKNHIDYILVVDQLWGILPSVNYIQNKKCRIGIVFHMFLQEDLIKKVLSMPFDDFFAVSEDIRSRILKINQKVRIELLPNSYDANEYYYDWTTKKKEKYILCNARLAKGKGIEYLLQAFENITEYYPDLKLTLCGGKFCFGDNQFLLQYVHDFIENNSKLNNKIVILPQLEWSSIPAVVRNAELIVLPSEYESFGIAALEAMASGVPLVSSDRGNLKLLVGNAGILTEYGNVLQLQTAMVSILENNELRTSVIKRELERAKIYESSTVAERFINRCNNVPFTCIG